MTLLLTAFGAFFIAEVSKAVLPTMHPWGKMLLALLGAAVVAVLLLDDVRETVAMALAGAGLGAIVHKVHRLVSAVGDVQQVAVMMKATRNGRRG